MRAAVRFYILMLAIAGEGCSISSSTSSARRQREARFEQNQGAIEATPSTENIRRRRERVPTDETTRLARLAQKAGARIRPIIGIQYLRHVFSRFDQLDSHLAKLEELDLEIAELERLIRSNIDRDINTVNKQDKFRDRARLEELAQKDSVRILHLGDSHVAADYITRTIRHRLQARFGNAGRGYIAVDQRARYGGRRLERKGWRRFRLIDPGALSRPMGFTGMILESTRPGASVSFELEPNDSSVTIHYVAGPGRTPYKVSADGFPLATLDASAPRIQTRSDHVVIDLPPPAPKEIVIEATGDDAQLLGLSFETREAGVLYDTVGPVGVDAKTYVSLNENSFVSQISSLAPDLVVLMIGGNDALALRKKRQSFEEVEQAHRELLRRIRKGAPNADCLIFGPMDAAEKKGNRYGSKTFVLEMVRFQKRLAKSSKCAFWNTFKAMGGEGSFGRWLSLNMTSKDLVHPRSLGGDLLGHMFTRALVDSYLAN